jgi:uncharacterized membrane protein YbhN (UPF0104 family)
MDRLSQKREQVRVYGLVGALVVFGGGLWLALAENLDLVAHLKVAPLIWLVVISAPIGTALNALELWALARISAGPMSMRTSLELTIYTSAANMLPLPGGAVTKLAGFKAHGVGYAVGIWMIVLSFLVWGGLAFLYAAAALAALGEVQLAGLFVIAGIAFLVAGAFGFARFGHWPMVALVAVTRLLNFMADALRYWLALTAMGVTVTFLQCSVFAVVAFLGAAVVFVPSGLGVSEAAGALVATFVGISAASGFISTAVQRIARLIGLAGIAVVFMFFRRTDSLSERAANPDPADTH